MTQPLPSQEAPTPQAPDHGQGASPAAGTAAPDSRRRLRIAAAVVIVLLAAAVLAVSLLRGNDDASGSAPADPGAQAEDQGGTGGDAASPSESDGGPADEKPADDGEAGSGPIAGSSERGAAFMDAVVMGDFPGALALGSAEFQARYDGDDGRLADELSAAAGGSLPDNYALESVEHDDASGTDVVSLRVTRPDGSSADMVVQVGQENGSAVVVGFE